MSDPWQTAERRMSELLADRAVFGLSREEEQELQQLARVMPDFDIDCMERAAATVQLAFLSVETMPKTLHDRIRAGAMPELQAGQDHGLQGPTIRVRPDLPVQEIGTDHESE